MIASLVAAVVSVGCAGVVAWAARSAWRRPALEASPDVEELEAAADGELVQVPPEFARDANLPKRVEGVPVVIDGIGPMARHVADGMPRSLQDVVGRVRSAAWESDDELAVDVSWGRFTSGRLGEQLLAGGHAMLRWDGRYVVLCPVAARRAG